MNRCPIIALVSLPLGLAVACGDDSSSDTGQGGAESGSNGGTQNGSIAGMAGSSSADAGSGGSSSGASAGGDSAGGAGGNNAGGASGTGGMAGSSSSGNLTPEDVCQRGCVKTEAQNCPNDPADCETACLADYLDFPAECRELVLVLGDCAADRPTSDFLCDDEGEAILRNGICGTESVAVATCLLSAL